MSDEVVDGSSLVVGMTGMGKSMLIAWQFLRSLELGLPCCYLDPKGDTYDVIVALLCLSADYRALWERLKHRIRFLDLTNPSDYILGFNAIELMAEFRRAKVDLVALTANNIVEHIRRLSGFGAGEAMRMQNIFLPSVALLAKGGYTLAELPYLYVETKTGEDYNPFVADLLTKTDHYGTNLFWKHQWANWNSHDRKNFVVSTEDRVFQYIFDERFLYSVCTQENATLDFREVVDEGIWMLVKLPYPVLQSNVTTILGNLIISKLFYTCMQRDCGDNPYRLIVDEARFFNTGSLDMILDTAHKFGLDVTLVIQSLDQLSKTVDGRLDERLLDAAMTNCRYIDAFHIQKIEDRHILAEMMFPLKGNIRDRTSVSGDMVAKPTVVEQNENERKFLELPKRELYRYNAMGKTEWLSTPDVVFTKPDWQRVDFFTGEHLRNTGRAAIEIRREIKARQEKVLSYFPEEVRSGVRQQAKKYETTWSGR